MSGATEACRELAERLAEWPRPVVLLEGTRALPAGAEVRLAAVAARLVEAMPQAIFRSGNAPGSDAAFVRGLGAAAAARLELVVPYAAHRQAARSAGRCVTLRQVDPGTLGALVELCAAATPRQADLFRRFADGRLPPALVFKARYLLRDALKVHGCADLNLAPATAAVLFLHPDDPDRGGAGHTRRVCALKGVPVFDQRAWWKWAEG